MYANQGDVLLPLSTLKRTDAQSVLLNWTQSKVKQTDKQMSTEGGQATNNLPAMQHRTKECLPLAGIFLCVCSFLDFFQTKQGKFIFR